MASRTQETRFKRKTRRSNAGKARKARLNNYGTTPKFPIHTDEADANAPSMAKGTAPAASAD